MEDIYLYHITPNDWGLWWITVAPNKETALVNLKNLLKNNAEEEENGRFSKYFTTDRELYEQWKNVTLDSLPHSYVIEEYSKSG